MQGGTRCWPNPEADQADSQTEVTTRVITAIVTGVVLNYLMAEIVLPRVDASYLAQALYGAVGLDAGLASLWSRWPCPCLRWWLLCGWARFSVLSDALTGSVFAHLNRHHLAPSADATALAIASADWRSKTSVSKASAANGTPTQARLAKPKVFSKAPLMMLPSAVPM